MIQLANVCVCRKIQILSNNGSNARFFYTTTPLANSFLNQVVFYYALVCNSLHYLTHWLKHSTCKKNPLAARGAVSSILGAMGGYGDRWVQCTYCRKWGKCSIDLAPNITPLADVDGIGVLCDPCRDRGGPPNYVPSHSMLTFVISIGSLLGRSREEVEPYAQVLEDNWFDKPETLKNLTTCELASIGIPLRFATALIKSSLTGKTETSPPFKAAETEVITQLITVADSDEGGESQESSRTPTKEEKVRSHRCSQCIAPTEEDEDRAAFMSLGVGPRGGLPSTKAQLQKLASALTISTDGTVGELKTRCREAMKPWCGIFIAKTAATPQPYILWNYASTAEVERQMGRERKNLEDRSKEQMDAIYEQIGRKSRAEHEQLAKRIFYDLECKHNCKAHQARRQLQMPTPQAHYNAHYNARSASSNEQMEGTPQLHSHMINGLKSGHKVATMGSMNDESEEDIRSSEEFFKVGDESGDESDTNVKRAAVVAPPVLQKSSCPTCAAVVALVQKTEGGDKECKQQ